MSNYKYKISVIMPVYCVREYIEMSVESVCKQDFKDDFELILVDDGTPDDSIVIAEKILHRYPKIWYRVVKQENKGLPAARNAGLREAHGEYISFIDSDDIITSDFLSTLYTACQSNHTKAAFVEYEVVHMQCREGKDNHDSGIKVLSREELLQNNMLRSIRIHLCAMLISNNFIKENGMYFNESLRFGEEVDYTWRMFPQLERISYICSPKYKYLVRNGSLMTAQKVERIEILLATMHRNITVWFSDYPEDEKKYKWVESKIYMEKLHAFAQNSSYSVFRKLIIDTNYWERTSKLSDFPDWKIRFLSKVLSICPFGYWFFFRITKF